MQTDAEGKKYKCRWCEERFKNEQERVTHHMVRRHWLEDE